MVPLDGRATVIVGRLRAEAPHAPPKRPGDLRRKTMRQASWLLDIQVAATAFAAGRDVATENRLDFEELSGVLGRLFPGAPRLFVASAPF